MLVMHACGPHQSLHCLHCHQICPSWDGSICPSLGARPPNAWQRCMLATRGGWYHARGGHRQHASPACIASMYHCLNPRGRAGRLARMHGSLRVQRHRAASISRAARTHARAAHVQSSCTRMYRAARTHARAARTHARAARTHARAARTHARAARTHASLRGGCSHRCAPAEVAHCRAACPAACTGATSPAVPWPAQRGCCRVKLDCASAPSATSEACLLVEVYNPHARRPDSSSEWSHGE